jgi:hypothetical protein
VHPAKRCFAQIHRPKSATRLTKRPHLPKPCAVIRYAYVRHSAIVVFGECSLAFRDACCAQLFASSAGHHCSALRICRGLFDPAGRLPIDARHGRFNRDDSAGWNPIGPVWPQASADSYPLILCIHRKGDGIYLRPPPTPRLDPPPLPRLKPPEPPNPPLLKPPPLLNREAGVCEA